MYENKLSDAKNYTSRFPIEKIRYANTLPIIRDIPGKIEQDAFSNPDKHLGGLVRYLVEGKNDVLFKIKIIHDWVADNIYYDLDTFHKGPKNADVSYQEVLKTKKTICAGYANLYEKMCEYAGIEILKISGIAKGLDPLGPHAWNAIKLNGKWYIIDTTWSSKNVYERGKFKKEPFNTRYFLLEPKYAIYNHLPDDEAYQFIDEPVTKMKFRLLPENPKVSYISSLFHEYDFKLLTSISPKMEVDGKTLQIRFESTDNCNLGAGAVNTGTTYINHYSFLQKFGGKYVLYIHPAKQGEYFIDVFITSSMKVLFSVTVNVKSTFFNDQPFPQLYKQYFDNNMCLYSPIEGTLKLNNTYNFKFYSHEEKDIYLMIPDGSTIPMNKNNNNIYYLDAYKANKSGDIYIVMLDKSVYHMLAHFLVM